MLNGSDGIAVGATRIPPHNLTEVAFIHLHVERVLAGEVDADGCPIISIKEYMERKRPTSQRVPTSTASTASKTYRTGEGRFHVRSRCEVVEDYSLIRSWSMKSRIRWTACSNTSPIWCPRTPSLAFVTFATSRQRKASAWSSKSRPTLTHTRCSTNSCLQRLQESYSANMMAIVDGRPVIMTLLTCSTFVAHRAGDRASCCARARKGCAGPTSLRAGAGAAAHRRRGGRRQAAAAVTTSSRFSVVETIAGRCVLLFRAQAKSIAERRLYQLSQIDVEKVEQEHAGQATILDLEDILASERRLHIMLSELDALWSGTGTTMHSNDLMPLSMDREDLIEERAIVITLSQDGYVPTCLWTTSAFRTAARLKGVTTKQEDTPMQIITCFSKDRLLIFTDQGRVWLKARKSPWFAAGLSHVKNLLEGLREEERISESSR